MPIIGIIIAVLLLGGGATLAVSDNAAPGDILFPVDRAVERFRLSVASDEKEAELRVKFAKERVEEVEKILAEEKKVDTDGDEDIEVSDGAAKNIDEGLGLALSLVGGLSGSEELEGVLDELLAVLMALPADRHSEFEIGVNDDEAKIKIRSGGVEIEYEVDEDGSAKVKIKGDNRGEGSAGENVPEVEIEIEEDEDVDEEIDDETEDEAEDEEEDVDEDEDIDDEEDADSDELEDDDMDDGDSDEEDEEADDEDEDTDEEDETGDDLDDDADEGEDDTDNSGSGGSSGN